jgi:pimeloyl-ACP methyl ester carboxylesterase
MDPAFAPAFAMAAEARWRYVLHFIPDNRSEILDQGREKARKAVTLDPRDPTCLRNDARMHSMFGQHDIAISKIEEAIALNPNDVLSHHFLGAFLCSAGRAVEDIPHLDRAKRLSSRDIFLTGMLTHRAFVAFDLERYEESFDWVRRASLSPNPRTMTFALLTAVLIKLGRQEEAQAALGDLLAHAPGITCAKYRENEFGAPKVMDRFVYALREAGLPEGGGPETKAPASDPPEMHQEIRFCTASDGVRIAYATVGQGPPLVKTANWLNHLEYDWESPIWRHKLQELAKDHLLVRYDERGNGLSDWDVDDISFEAFVRDLETVVDAAGLERFPFLGISQGCSVSIAYAVRHPERVTYLILYGGYARGQFRRGSAEKTEQAEVVITLMQQGWGQENPAFRQIFTSNFIPGATQEQMRWFNDLQRMTASPENAVRIRRAVNDIDVSAMLPEVTTPALVLHCRNEAAVPFEEGRLMASMIPGARFVALEGQNHLILEDEPAWPRFLEEVRSFLD